MLTYGFGTILKLTCVLKLTSWVPTQSHVPLHKPSTQGSAFRVEGLGRHSVEYEGFGTPNFGGGVTKFKPREAPKLIVGRPVDF